MTQTIANLETQLRQQNEQRQRAETDLNAVKNLCIMLERQKDGLLQQIKDKDEMKAQVRWNDIFSIFSMLIKKYKRKMKNWISIQL